MHHSIDLTNQLKAHALSLGIDLVGVAPAAPTAQGENYQRWLARGFHGEMAYLARPDAISQRLDVRQRFSEGNSIIVVGVFHAWPAVPTSVRNDPSRGQIAAYAWTADYHDVIKPKLYALDAWLREKTGRSTPGRVGVDSAPVLERAWAEQAGLGFVGKNTCLIHPKFGSWFLLGTLLVPEVFDYNTPPSLSISLKKTENAPPSQLPSWIFEDGNVGSCGSCTRCLTACPTSAFVDAYELDARRCISYLTIELRGAIPHELRPLMGNWIFGCDVCQLVCPWDNPRRVSAKHDYAARPPVLMDVAPPLLELAGLDEQAFRARFRGSALRRTGRRGLLRNVCVALGNWRSDEALPALLQCLSDVEPLIRGHAVWALSRLASNKAKAALEKHGRQETDAFVQSELTAAFETFEA